VGGEGIGRFRRRAEEERARAVTILDPATAKACRQLADQYDDVVRAYESLSLTTARRTFALLTREPNSGAEPLHP
jgi:hypothetical protein